MGCRWVASAKSAAELARAHTPHHCSNHGPGSVSPFEEEEQVQGTVATCPVSPQQGKIGVRVRSRAGLRPRHADSVLSFVGGLFSVTALIASTIDIV